MRNSSILKKFLYKASLISLPVVAGLSSGVGFAIDADLDAETYQSWPTVFIVVIQLLKNHSFFLLSMFLVVALLASIGLKVGDPWIWDKLQFILDEYKNKALNSKDSDPDHYHRVTLFKYKKFIGLRKCPSGTWKSPWNGNEITGGWLVPVLRSGHTSKKTSIVFAAPDNADQAEGIVGQAWSCKRPIIVVRLGEVKSTMSEQNKQKYAAKTFCSIGIVEHYIKTNRPAPRSIAAIPLEVDGKIWGVIVLDSRNATGVSEDAIVNYSLTAATISQLLERV